MNTVTAIRKSLKNIGLSNRDVSVKEEFGGFESAIRITIKNKKAYALKSNIKKIANTHENIDHCTSSGEVLEGGNTFVFVGIAPELEMELIQA